MSVKTIVARLWKSQDDRYCELNPYRINTLHRLAQAAWAVAVCLQLDDYQREELGRVLQRLDRHYERIQRRHWRHIAEAARHLPIRTIAERRAIPSL